jgi:hypothetical protein
MVQNFLLLVAGAVIALSADRVRWHREDRRHWNQERREVYQRFLTALDEWRELDWVLAMELGDADGPDWEHAAYMVAGDDESVIGRLRLRVGTANERVTSTLADMELVASSQATEAARTLWKRAREVSAICRDYPPRHCGGVSDILLKADEELGDRRDAFVAHVRSELGVPA